MGASSLASSCNQCLGRPFKVSYDWGVSGVVGMVTGIQTEEYKVPLMDLFVRQPSCQGRKVDTILPSSDTTPTSMVCGGVCTLHG